MNKKHYLSFTIGILLFNPAWGVVNNDIYIGTWSSVPSGAAASQGIATGGHYVLKATYDTNTILAGPTNCGGVNVPFCADLSKSGNSFDAYIPLLSSIDHQTAADNFFIANEAPFAQIQFFDALGTKFRGINFESQILPNRNTGPLIFEQFTRDATHNYGSGNIPVVNSIGQILDSNSFNVLTTSITSDVLTKDIKPLAAGGSGGVAFPGVFLSKAVPVIADAGSALTWNASNFATAKTTNGGTAVVTDTPTAIDTSGNTVRPPAMALTGNLTRQADNNLGAGRTDKQDFLNYVWNVNGSNVNGNLDGVRQHSIGLLPDAAGTPAHFVDNGSRTVSDVNINVSLAASGVLHPNDVKNIGLTVTEDMTGLTGTANTSATYTNAAPTAVSGNNLNFNGTNLTRTETVQATDADRAVNATIANFESTKLDVKQGVNQLATFTDTGSATTVSHGFSVTLAQSGLTNTLDTKTLTVQATDFAGASASNTVTASYTNAAPTSVSGNNLNFDAANLTKIETVQASDVDRAANAIVANFESTKLDVKQGVNQLATFTDTGSATTISHGFSVALAQSGLTNTLDTKTLTVQATDFAGASASSTVTASYTNTLPLIPVFTATTQGGDILFGLHITDADLAVNSVVTGFEDVQANIFHNGILINDPAFNTLLLDSIGETGASKLLTDASLFNLFGAGLISLDVRVTDRFLRSQGANSFVSDTVTFNVTNPNGNQGIPEPSSLMLLGGGLASLRLASRRRKA